MTEPILWAEPTTVDEAIMQLQRYGDTAKLVAGATAVSIMLRQRLIRPAVLVSLQRIDELRAIHVSSGWLEIGALVTHHEVETSPEVRHHLPLLAKAFGEVASVRVRNAATVGGVVAEADYASDPPCALVALDALIVSRGPAGERSTPASAFFTGFYATSLDSGEIVTQVRIPLLDPKSGVVYEKVRTRSLEDRPCLGVAAVVRLESRSHKCTDLRVCVGAATEIPLRLRDVESTAQGVELTDSLASAIAGKYAEAADTLDDLRGSAWYRRQLISVWVRRSILAARQDSIAKASSA